MHFQIEPGAWPFPATVAPARDDSAFHGFVVNGNTSVKALAVFYGLRISTVHREKAIADYLREHLHGYPLTGDRVPLGAIELVVLKKSARVVELAGLDLRQHRLMSRVRYRGPARRQTRQ
jgi:NhaP-type Na+/H+ and K+/H+ antiporter